MRIIELECKKCKYSFTRLVKEKEELKNEKCGKCGGEVKITNDISLGKSGSDCTTCGGCGGGGCSPKPKGTKSMKKK